MKKTLIALAVLAASAFSAAPGLAQTSGCYICECNDAASRCQFSCQGSSGSYISLQQCAFTCQQTYSKCLDAAYAAIKAEEEAAQAESSTTSF